VKNVNFALLSNFIIRVVLRLGSQAPFSPELTELQEEVRPLWKASYPCPRDFKRTKVERLFRNSGFHMDWCSFRLVCTQNQLRLLFN
jgi:alpha-sarcoglycan